MKFIEEINSLSARLNGTGVFLTAGSKPNTMTASWGFAGVMWGKNVLIMPVRPSRFTHGLICESREFAVSVPLDNKLNRELGYFGSVSGKCTDKYSAVGITPIKCQTIGTSIIPGNCCHFECKVLYKNTMLDADLPDFIKQKWYDDKSYHTMFYGEILNVYNTK